MLARVRIEHEIHQRAFQARAQPAVHREPRGRDLRRAFQVQDAEFGTKIPMRLGREVERARRAPAVDLDVILGAAPHGNRLVRKVRHAGERQAKLLVKIAHLLIEPGNALADLTHLLLPLRGIDALLSQLGDLAAFRVAQGFQLLGLGHGGAPSRIEFAKCVHVKRKPARSQAARDRIQIGAEIVQIVHVRIKLRIARRARS